MKNKLEILISNIETSTNVLNINYQKRFRKFRNSDFEFVSDLDIRYSIFPLQRAKEV